MREGLGQRLRVWQNEREMMERGKQVLGEKGGRNKQCSGYCQ